MEELGNGDYTVVDKSIREFGLFKAKKIQIKIVLFSSTNIDDIVVHIYQNHVEPEILPGKHTRVGLSIHIEEITPVHIEYTRTGKICEKYSTISQRLEKIMQSSRPGCMEKMKLVFTAITVKKK